MLGVVVGVLALYFSMPNPLYQIGALSFFAFVPLFLQLRKYRRYFAISFLYSILFSLLMLIPLDLLENGLVLQIIPLALILFMLIASIYAVMFSICALCCEKFGWKFDFLIFPVGWGIVQLLLLSTPVTFAFPIETSLIMGHPLIGAARYIGGIGVGMFIILMNIKLSEICFERSQFSRNIVFIIISVILCAAVGSIDLPGRNHCISTIKAIQPAVSNLDYKLRSLGKLMKNYYDGRLLTMSQSSDQTRALIVWPELMGDYLLQDDEKLKLISKSILNNGSELMAGTSYLDHINNKTKNNIAFILRPDRSTCGPYFKQKLFPFIETQSFTSRGSGVILNSKIAGNIGTMICLESIYPQVARQHIKNGADILITISTDAAFGNSMIPYIHAASTVVRGIENRRPSVHASNMGPSIIADATGKILSISAYGKASLLKLDADE